MGDGLTVPPDSCPVTSVSAASCPASRLTAGFALTLGGVAHVGLDEPLPCRVDEGVAQADVRVEGGLAAPVPHDRVAHVAHVPGFQVLETDVAYRYVAVVAPVGLVHPWFGVGAFVFLEPSVEQVAQEWGPVGPDPAGPLVFGQDLVEFSHCFAPDPVALVKPAAFPRGRVGGQFAAEMPVFPLVLRDCDACVVSALPCASTHSDTSGVYPNVYPFSP